MGALAQARAFVRELRIVPFAAAMRILPAGACLWFGSSSPELSPFSHAFGPFNAWLQKTQEVISGRSLAEHAEGAGERG
jgi:hypothetical protein